MGDVVGGLGAAKQGLDYTIGTGAVTSPWWVQHVQAASDLFALLAAIGGVALVAIRIAIAWREWRVKRCRI